ncbi:MAG: ABC transporter permease [Candidatus Thermochlorobacter aerophilum]|jgi:ABC-2 type transport system permease protein|uniref:ABC transporter permease n=1 Tax=Candidatus Thermochlorobacter aerophilus TaxID=1868324 RepID=A0A395M222_9BACT|nr:MAG: ABC transporter permease [Candidatus Thermochlorobacter aerophilum]
MNKTAIVIRKEYLERVKSKGFIISTILIPVLMSSFIVIPILITFLSRDSKTVIAIHDATGKYQSAIESALEKQETFSILWVDWQKESEREATLKGIETGKITGYLLLKEVDGKLEAVYTAKNIVDFGINRKIENTIQKAVSRLFLKNKGFTDDDIATLEKPIELKTQKISGSSQGDKGALSEFLLAYVMVMLIYGTLLSYGIAVMSSVMEEKSSKVMEVLIASVKPFELMVGKLVGIGLVAFTQYLIWAVVAFALSAVSLQYNPKFQIDLSPILLMYFVLYFMLGYLIYATLYAAVGSAFENPEDAQSLTAPITFLVIVPIVAMSYVISKPDSVASVILSLIPFFSPILMMGRLAVTDVPFWQVLLSIALMIGTFYGVMFVSAKIYRIGVLMYGKKPTLAEILKWVRYA